MLSNKPRPTLRVLITRPEKSGRLLAEKLNGLGISSICQPLFDYRQYSSEEKVKSLLFSLNQPIIIFVSVAAVEYAQQSWPLSQWKYSHIISVGNATKNALRQLNISSICPKQQTSEGVLTLPLLSEIKGQDILIVRGDGGRELLAEQLSAKYANVCYLESYQRIWRKIPSEQVTQWQDEELNCIVVTSNAILENTISLFSKTNKTLANSYLWVVASERIANNAKKLGISNVINANGASDELIISTLISQFNLTID